MPPPRPPSCGARSISRRNGWSPKSHLDFDLGPERTIVRATLHVERNGDHAAPLRLNAAGLTIVAVTADGAPVNYWYEHDLLKIPVDGDAATIETEVAIAPARQHPADGPLRIGRHALHAVRGAKASAGSPSSPTGPTCSAATR